MTENKEKIISLAGEYVKNTECACSSSEYGGYWHCLFEYNVAFVDAEAKPGSIIKDGKSGQEIIKILEAGIEERDTAIAIYVKTNEDQLELTKKLTAAVLRHAETIMAKQKHIVALEKENKRLKAKKSWRAAVYERISLIGRKHEV